MSNASTKTAAVKVIRAPKIMLNRWSKGSKCFETGADIPFNTPMLSMNGRAFCPASKCYIDAKKAGVEDTTLVAAPAAIAASPAPVKPAPVAVDPIPAMSQTLTIRPKQAPRAAAPAASTITLPMPPIGFTYTLTRIGQ